MDLTINLSPEVTLVIFSAMFICLICILLLNELEAKRIKRNFKRPDLSLVREEYKKELRKSL